MEAKIILRVVLNRELSVFERVCALVKCLSYRERDTFTYHLKEVTGKVLYKYRVFLLLQIEPSE